MGDDAIEELGFAIDAMDNLAHALQLPMPADLHVRAMKESLPGAVQALKEAFVKVTGNNPWA